MAQSRLPIQTAIRGVGFAEDRGGNSIEVRFNGRKENLHSLWDTALVELEQGTPTGIAARIQAVVTAEDRQQWQQGTPTEWALESWAIVTEPSTKNPLYCSGGDSSIRATILKIFR